MSFIKESIEERKARAERRRKAREEGLLDSVEGIEEYYLEIEGYTIEEATPYIERECKSRGIVFEHKSWVSKRMDDAKIVMNFVKDHPKEIEIILPIVTTALTSLFSFAAGALLTKNNKEEGKGAKHTFPQPSEPIDRSTIERAR